MGHRIQSRQTNGRYRQATIANTFGLAVLECPNPACRLLQPYRIGDDKPTVCHTCGTVLEAAKEQKAE